MSAKLWFISHPSGGRQHAPTFFDALERFDVERRNVKLLFPHPDQEQMHLTKKDIESADMVVAEVSLSSTGSGIELGWANAAGKSIIAFHQGLSPISPALPFIADAIHIYLNDEDIYKVLDTLT